MARSWKPTGRIELLYKRLPPSEDYGGRRRDQLASLTGIDPTVLSQYNTGKRRLTMDKAQKIINGLANVGIEITPDDLGRPPGWDDDELTLGARLADLAAKLADSLERQKKMDAELRRLRTRLGKLEAQRAPASAAPKRPRKRAAQ